MSNLYLIEGGKTVGAINDAVEVDALLDTLTGATQEQRGKIKDHNTRQQEINRACNSARKSGLSNGLYLGIAIGLMLGILIGLGIGG